MRLQKHLVLLACAALAGCAIGDSPPGDEPAHRAASSERPGTLDPSFGGLGYVHASAAGGALWLTAIRQVDGGKVVVGGSNSNKLGGGVLESFRFLDDGAPDLSFNGKGSASYNPCQCSGFDGEIYGIDRRDDGTLLFAGWTHPRTPPGGKWDQDILLLRYRDDGTLGGAPGDMGINLVDLGGYEHVHAAAFPAGEDAVLVAGDRDGEMFIAKVLARGGRLDAQGFAAPRGWVPIDVGGQASDARAMALDAEGRIVVAGWVEADGQRETVIARLLASGALDASFGAGGVVRLPHAGGKRACGVAVLPDGRIAVAGDTGDPSETRGGDARRFSLVRLLPSGALDPAFGEGGRALAPLGPSTFELSSSIVMARMSDGRLVVGGTGTLGGVEGPVLARFLPDGSLDPSFGEGGEATYVVGKGPGWRESSKGGGTNTTLQALALSRDETRLLVAGTWSSYAFQGYVARLRN